MLNFDPPQNRWIIDMSNESPYQISGASASLPRSNLRFWTSTLMGLIVGVASQGAFWALENAEIGSEWFPSQWFFIAGLIFGVLGLNGFGMVVGIIIGYVLIFIPFYMHDSLFPAIVIISICVTSTAPLGWLISYPIAHGIRAAGNRKKSKGSPTGPDDETE